jgi:hypothetical protein
MSPAAYNAIKDYLVLGNLARVLDFDEADNELTQGGDLPFIVLEEAYGDEATVCIGNGGTYGVDETGTVLIHSFAPNPDGSGFVRTLGEAVRQRMAGASLLNGELFIERCGPPEPVQLGNGRWADGVVSLDYRYHTDRVAFYARA